MLHSFPTSPCFIVHTLEWNGISFVRMGDFEGNQSCAGHSFQRIKSRRVRQVARISRGTWDLVAPEVQMSHGGAQYILAVWA